MNRNACDQSRPSVPAAQAADTSAPEGYREIRWKAMDLLARREYARRELLTRLGRHFPDQMALAEAVLDDLAAGGLQCDQRFTEAYTAMRKRKGYGPARIRMELQDRGVDRDLIGAELASEQHDWYALAAEVWRKKFGTLRQAEGGELDARAAAKERARQVRFLQYRGFLADHIQSLLD